MKANESSLGSVGIQVNLGLIKQVHRIQAEQAQELLTRSIEGLKLREEKTRVIDFLA